MIMYNKKSIITIVILFIIEIVIVSSNNNTNDINNDYNYSLELYRLAYKLHSNINNNISKNKINSNNVKIHLIRVPKASSSSLSAVARRIVGCSPPGPCCKWPGEPKGSCPSKDLFKCHEDGRVIGCVHHYPNYKDLVNPFIISISMMREPNMRALSAFFYPGIHHNSECTKYIGQYNNIKNVTYDKCFLEYTKNLKWQNIVVKLVTGIYAYKPERTCRYKANCKYSLEIALNNLKHFTLMGISEMWPLSLLLLHTKLRKKFSSFIPLLEEFSLGDEIISINNNNITRSNSNNNNYKLFKATALSKYSAELDKQNELDVLLYQKALENFCNDLFEYELWQYKIVRDYWKEKAIISINRCIT